MKWNEIRIGEVYRSKKGLCRKVIRFVNWHKNELAEMNNIVGNHVEYVPCDQLGNPNGKPSLCWYMTFANWSKERLENDGKTPLERASNYANRLYEMGCVTEANAIQAAFRLYGERIELPKASETTEIA